MKYYSFYKKQKKYVHKVLPLAGVPGMFIGVIPLLIGTIFIKTNHSIANNLALMAIYLIGWAGSSLVIAIMISYDNNKMIQK